MPEPAVAEHKKLTRKDTLNFKERRMHEDIWLVQGENYNGSHFPIACFTDSYRRRSEEKHKERWERDKQRKGRGKGVPKLPNRFASNWSGINEDLQRQQPAVAVPNQDAQWGWTNKKWDYWPSYSGDWGTSGTYWESTSTSSWTPWQ